MFPTAAASSSARRSALSRFMAAAFATAIRFCSPARAASVGAAAESQVEAQRMVGLNAARQMAQGAAPESARGGPVRRCDGSAAFCVPLRSLRQRLRSAAFQGPCVLLRSAFPAFCVLLRSSILRSRLAAFCCVLGSCVLCVLRSAAFWILRSAGFCGLGWNYCFLGCRMGTRNHPLGYPPASCPRRHLRRLACELNSNLNSISNSNVPPHP